MKIGLFEMTLSFSDKNPDFFYKTGEDGKFAVECVSQDKFSQNCLCHVNCNFFLQKSKCFQTRKNYRN